MSIYVKGSDSINSRRLTQTEVDLYGSSRLGIYRLATDMEQLAPSHDTTVAVLGKVYDTSFTRGYKQYELTNHLGNVLVTISDRKIAIPLSSDTTKIDRYKRADVITANDYYPFGMLMPQRVYPAIVTEEPPCLAGGSANSSPVTLYKHQFEGTPIGSIRM